MKVESFYISFLQTDLSAYGLLALCRIPVSALLSLDGMRGTIQRLNNKCPHGFAPPLWGALCRIPVSALLSFDGMRGPI